MQDIHTADVPWTDKTGYSKRVFLDSTALRHPGAQVQEIRIKPHDEAGAHYHKKQTEIFFFLNTNGYFTVNDKKFQPRAGDIFVVEPGDIHRVTNNTDEDFLYLAFKLSYEEGDSYWIEDSGEIVAR